MRPRGASADAWAEVARHAARLRSIPTRSLFAADAARVERMSLDVAGLHLDFSKQRIDNDAMEALRVLARSADVAAQIRQQFAGDAVNFTEGRAALHMALRAPKDAANPPGGPAIASDVHGVLDRIEAFDDRVRTGAWVGA